MIALFVIAAFSPFATASSIVGVRVGRGFHRPSPVQRALELIEKARQRQRELNDGKEVPALPGDGYEVEDVEVRRRIEGVNGL
ncbi:MAG: hypothetical protein V2A61_01235 [Calditrichota bacterium]